MTDYRLTAQRSRLKLFLLSLLAVPAVNFVVVGVLKRLPHADFRTRIPVKGQEGHFSSGAPGPIKAERDWLFSIRTPEDLRALGWTVDKDGY